MSLCIYIPGFSEEMEKIALLETPLQPHQQRVVNRIQQPDQPGLVVAHGLGSGKTLTSIAAQEALQMPSDVVVPAALQENYAKERRKHLSGSDNQQANVSSMQNMASKKIAPKNPLLIVDEAHRAREPGSQTQKVLQQNEAKKRLLLTGSPFYNHPADIAPLVNLAAGDRVLPQTREDFSKKYITDKTIKPGFINRLRGVKPGVEQIANPHREAELKKIFGKWVDYHPGSSEHFPEVTHEDVRVPMTPEQLQVYDTMLKKAPPWVSMKIRSRLPPSKQESQNLNAFLSATRQVSNTTAPFESREGVPNHDPKIDTAFNRLQSHFAANPNSKAMVYSNYLGAGLDPYKARLDEAKIPYGEFSGQMSRQDREQTVRDYNANKIKALLLSSAGGEGLDLQGTRLIQMLEPHWNSEKGKQVEGRGIRYKSHDALPPEERKVLIENYLATRPRSGVMERLHLQKPGGSVDEYLSQLSASKEKLVNQFRGLLPQAPQQPAPVVQP